MIEMYLTSMTTFLNGFNHVTNPIFAFYLIFYLFSFFYIKQFEDFIVSCYFSIQNKYFYLKKEHKKNNEIVMQVPNTIHGCR